MTRTKQRRFICSKCGSRACRYVRRDGDAPGERSRRVCARCRPERKLLCRLCHELGFADCNPCRAAFGLPQTAGTDDLKKLLCDPES